MTQVDLPSPPLHASILLQNGDMLNSDRRACSPARTLGRIRSLRIGGHAATQPSAISAETTSKRFARNLPVRACRTAAAAELRPSGD
jgi:hypothetical protein